MRIYLAILAAIFVLAIYVAVQDQRAASKSEGESQQLVNPSASAPHENHTQNDKGKSEWHPPRWHRIFAWPEGVTTLAIILTLLAIAEQTSATKRAVTASLRPKVVIRGIEFVPGEGGTFAPGNVAPWHIRFIVANSGGSEAKISESNLTFAYDRDFSDGLNIVLPPFPPYSKNPLTFGAFSLRAGDHTAIDIRMPDEMSSQFAFRESAKRNSIQVARTFMFWIGFLRYKDEGGITRTTGFAFRYDLSTNGFSLMAEPGYNYTD